MSFNPATIPSVPFIGQPYSIPVNLGSIAARAIPLQFIWETYGVSQVNNQVAVNISLNVNNQTVLGGAIRGCYIDNTGSDCAIYVYFSDTQVTIPCAPFSAVWSPVTTGIWNLTVIGRGFSTNDQSQTLVTLFNIGVPPAEIAELNVTYPQFSASPSISRGLNIYSNGYASPAIGDQFQTGRLTDIGGLTTRLFNSPYLGGGLITLTDWSITLLSNGTPVVSGEYTIQSTGASGIYYQGDFAQSLDSNNSPYSILMSKTGLQHKLNAAETWEIITPTLPATGFLTYHFGFSYKGTGSATTPSMPISIGLLADAPSGQITGVGGLAFYGLQFTPASTFNITNISPMFVQVPGGTGGLNVTMSIYTDVGGSPGLVLGSVNTTPNQMVANATAFASSILVAAAQTYWLVIQMTTNATFNFVTLGGTGFASGNAATAAGITADLNMGGANRNWCWQINGQSA